MVDDSEKHRIALTMGDPAGVGPELVLRALSDPSTAESCDLLVFGDASVLRRCAEQLPQLASGLQNVQHILSPSEFAELSGTAAERPAGHVLVDLCNVDATALKTCEVSAEAGRASFQYIQAAIDAALPGNVAAVTTAPINKAALRAAGIHYPGHTEMFADRAQSDRWCMMQYSTEITCTFVTVHVGYAEVPALLTTERILETIELTAEALQQIRGKAPKIVVCGLNPHAGENGLFGDGEEQRAIVPAIERARAQGIHIEGPLPPDTAFLPWKRRETDAFVCMYHDQGHIPVKALAFDSAVNTTLGLEIIRTSVDHGTAFDIAWTGKSRPDSLFAALELAVRLAGKK